MDLTGKAGFYLLPGSKKWSAWLSLSSGSLRMVPNNLPLTLTANRIALQAGRLEGRGLHLSTPHSDIRFDLVLPYDKSHAMSLRWHAATLALREFGLDNDQQMESSGSIVSQQPPPELTGVQTQPRTHPSGVYTLDQQLQFEGHQYTMNGRLERPFSDHFAFQGRLQFAAMDTSVLTGLFNGLKMAAVGEKVRRFKKLSNLAGSLYLDTKKGQDGRLWRGTLNLRQGMLGDVQLRQVELPFKLTGDGLRVSNGLIDTDQGSFNGNMSYSLVPSRPLFAAHGKIANFSPAIFPVGILAGKNLAATAEFSLDQIGNLTFGGELEPMQIDEHLFSGGPFFRETAGRELPPLRSVSLRWIMDR